MRDHVNDSEESKPKPDSLFGKKVFFLNPHSVIIEVMAALSEAEFEVYSTREDNKLINYLSKNPNCLVFVNIDEGDNPNEWYEWILNLKNNSETAYVPVGVISLNNDPDLKLKFVMELGVECGYIVVKLGTAKTTEIILKTLEANEARGRRRYVRAECSQETAEFNLTIQSKLVRGWIRDISVVGMSIYFPEDVKSPPVGSKLIDLQMTLKGLRILINGVVVGCHMTEEYGMLSVVMFEPHCMNEDKRSKIRTYIRRTLQANMNVAISEA